MGNCRLRKNSISSDELSNRLKAVGIKRIVKYNDKKERKIEYEFPLGSTKTTSTWLWPYHRIRNMLHLKSFSKSTTSSNSAAQVQKSNQQDNRFNDTRSNKSNFQPIKTIRISRPSNDFSPAIFDSLYNITTLDQSPGAIDEDKTNTIKEPKVYEKKLSNSLRKKHYRS
ncbi:hypothetical protein GJ496_001749 [Pomphorhynchus laevis]|nr:hypothetical protein GJ496_001749 [Pomphorhynchus laevis]